MASRRRAGVVAKHPSGIMAFANGPLAATVLVLNSRMQQHYSHRNIAFI